jgi:pseudouridine kinase
MFDNPISPKPDNPALVIGAAGVDIVGRLRGELRPESSTPAQIRSSLGGVARNVAETLARLGHAVNLISAVGDDEIGDKLLKNVSEAGVNVDAVLKTSQYPTGTYLAVVNQAGVLQFALDDIHTISALTPEYIRLHEALFAEASVLFIDANLSKDTLRTIMSLARKHRLPVCADPTSSTLASKLKPYLNRLYLITPNSAEAVIYCDPDRKITTRRQALETAQHLVNQGVQVAIITRAEQGLCYATSETKGYIPAIRTDITDPTGAGDAISATVIFALLNNIPLDDAVRLGVSAASLTLRYRGAVVPDLSLEKLYDQLVI